MSECFELSAHELLDAYRAGDLSPVEVILDLGSRIELANPQLNAFQTLTIERAAAEARDAEAAWRRHDARPLEGVPFGVKDLFDTAEVRTTYGSPMFHQNVPGEDAAAVSRTRSAGAILVGKTSTDEFAYGIAGVNPHYGAVLNPWAHERVSGGSSSGSGAALAARMVPLALGSDTGGSILSPASYCGVVGFKGTWATVSTSGMWPMGRTIDHVGPMTRTPADAALLLSVIAHGSIGAVIAADLADGLAPAAPGIRVGVCPDLDPLGLPPDLQRVFDAVCARLADSGCRLADVRFCDAELARETFIPIRDAETLWTHRTAGLFPQRCAEYSERTYARLDAARAVGLDEYLAALAVRQRLDEAFDRLFDDVDVLLAPVTSAPPPLIAENADEEVWNKTGVHTVPADLLGVPACAFRAGFDDLGLPVGLQLIGRKGSDATVLSVVQLYTDATPSVQLRWPG